MCTLCMKALAMCQKHGAHTKNPHLCQLRVGVHNGAELHSLQFLYTVSMVPWPLRAVNAHMLAVHMD